MEMGAKRSPKQLILLPTNVHVNLQTREEKAID